MFNFLKEFLWFAPKLKVKSSQTFYQLAFALQYLQVEDVAFVARFKKQLLAGLLGQQRPNGGFDIGFNFLFGTGKIKPYAACPTTPETLSVFGLYLLMDEKNSEKIIRAIIKHRDWLATYTTDISPHRIAYCPEFSTVPHIVNSTNFASVTSAILLKLKVIEKEPLYLEALKENLIINQDGNTAYYPYFLFSSTLNSNESQLTKVDNYHLAQQGWSHLMRFKLGGDNDDLSIASQIFNFFLHSGAEAQMLNYCRDPAHTPMHVPLWGAMSLVQFCGEYYQITKDTRAITIIRLYSDFVLSFERASGRYPAVVSVDEDLIDACEFIRGDAWICHGFSCAFDATKDDLYNDAAKRILFSIKERGFRGREPNRWTIRKLLSLKLRDILCGNHNAHY